MAFNRLAAVNTLAADPAALHASFAIYRVLDATIAQNQQRKARRLRMPVLGIGAKSLRDQAAATMKLAARRPTREARRGAACFGAVVKIPGSGRVRPGWTAGDVTGATRPLDVRRWAVPVVKGRLVNSSAAPEPTGPAIGDNQSRS